TTYRQRRANEFSADSLGLAYYRNLQFSLAGARQALDALSMRDLAHLREVDFVSLLQTESYPVKEQWLEAPATLFGGSFGGGEAPAVGFWQTDSVATHPAMDERIVRLDSILLRTTVDTSTAETTHVWLDVVDRELIRAQLENGTSGLAFINSLRLLHVNPERTDLQALLGESLFKTYKSIEEHDFDDAVPPPTFFREPTARKAARMLRRLRKSELKKLTLAYLTERSQARPDAPELTELLSTAQTYFSSLD
ncbi:MAG: hypothetical protein AAFN92_05095, partial [Bacteroidota bacterium]